MPKSTKKPSLTLDPKKVLHDLAQGRTQTQIAKKYSVNDMAVSRFVKKIKASVGLTHDLEKSRADAFAMLHGQSLSILSDALILLRDKVERDVKLVENGFPGKLDLSQILSVVKGAGWNQAIVFDKLRLERGESTQNVGLAGMVMHFHDNVGIIDPKTGELRQEIESQRPSDQPITEVEHEIVDVSSGND